MHSVSFSGGLWRNRDERQALASIHLPRSKFAHWLAWHAKTPSPS